MTRSVSDRATLNPFTRNPDEAHRTFAALRCDAVVRRMSCICLRGSERPDDILFVSNSPLSDSELRKLDAIVHARARSRTLDSKFRNVVRSDEVRRLRCLGRAHSFQLSVFGPCGRSLRSSTGWRAWATSGDDRNSRLPGTSELFSRVPKDMCCLADFREFWQTVLP